MSNEGKKNLQPSQLTAGGAAAQAGFAFQNLVATWISTKILAEEHSTPPWGLPSGTKLTWLRCETEQPIDDILVGTSNEGRIFIQVKHRVNLESGNNTALASFIDQCVRQYLTWKRRDLAGPSWERSLDPERDRLVLIAGPNSSISIREVLPNVLQKIKINGSLNNREDKAFTTVKEHLDNAWRSVCGGTPTIETVKEILSFITVHILEVEENGVAEREAKDTLRRAVLHDTEQVDMCWSFLVQICGNLSINRGGLNRSELLERLLHVGFKLKLSPSYKSDISQLKGYTKNVISYVSDLSTIRVGQKELKVSRKCTNILRASIEDKSVVVVGEPGAGKSGVLHDLVTNLIGEERDVVFLAVDRLDADGYGLLKTDLGLSHDLFEVLENWYGDNPGFIVIDAMDAARSENSAQVLRDLITRIIRKQNRWRVIASIRKFDLRHDQNLRQLFDGMPVSNEYFDDEFKNLCHIKIPIFSDEELIQATNQSPELEKLIIDADLDFKQLMYVPFNLRLMAELIGNAVPFDQLTPIRSQIDLLERYWTEKVIGRDGLRDAREIFLKKLANEMVANRSLKAERLRVVDIQSSTIMHELLRSNVLIEWSSSYMVPNDGMLISFSHHVLFDYAIARLLLRGNPDLMFDLIASNPDLVLVIRPSIVHHFRYFWSIDQNRDVFWNLLIKSFENERIPEIAKLIGPVVATELGSIVEDFLPLTFALGSPNEQTKKAAELAFRHISGAILTEVIGTSRKTILGDGAGPWPELMEYVSRLMSLSNAYAIRALLDILCEHTETFTVFQYNQVGLTSRRLLTFARQQDPIDNWLVISSLQCVCRTFSSDSAASAQLIKVSLEKEHLSRFGYIELPWLSREVMKLLDNAPTLVKDIYSAAFSYTESSKEVTAIGSSRIIPLQSNRGQDYNMALYELSESYPEFLRRSPIYATQTLITVVESYVNEKHSSSIEEQVYSFEVMGIQAEMKPDHSGIWDSGNVYEHEEALKMLNHFENFLKTISEDKIQIELLERIIREIINKNKYAILWRRLIKCSFNDPAVLGSMLRSLAWSVPILTGFDTRDLAGKFLNVIFPILSDEEKDKVERIIFEIPTKVDNEKLSSVIQLRDRLLGCLPRQLLRTSNAIQRLEELDKIGGPPINKPVFEINNWESSEYGEREYLKELGVPVEEEANKMIQILQAPLKSFSQKHLNTSPNIEEIQKVIPSVNELHQALLLADSNGVHPKQRDYAIGTLVETCARIASCDNLDLSKDIGSIVRNYLLQHVLHSDPKPNPEYDIEFDRTPSWGKPAVRIDVAEGLTLLARFEAYADDQVLASLKVLIMDKVPAVRFQVATRLIELYKTDNKLMWELIDYLSKNEMSRGVLHGLLARAMSPLATRYPDRMTDLIKTIFERVIDGAGADNVREACVSILLGLYIWKNQDAAKGIIFETIDSIPDMIKENKRILLDLRDLLTIGSINHPNNAHEEARHRAWPLFSLIITKAKDELTDLKTIVQNKSLSHSETERMKHLYQTLDDACTQLYFASGVFDDKRQRRSNNSSNTLGLSERKRFLYEASDIINQLSEIGLPSITHHLLEILDYLSPLDVEGIFLRVGKVVKNGTQGGYQFESMATDLIVRFVERYLAEHRDIFQNNFECRNTLIEILDIFVIAGWPSAHRLTYRLEEIFR